MSLMFSTPRYTLTAFIITIVIVFIVIISAIATPRGNSYKTNLEDKRELTVAEILEKKYKDCITNETTARVQTCSVYLNLPRHGK